MLLDGFSIGYFLLGMRLKKMSLAKFPDSAHVGGPCCSRHAQKVYCGERSYIIGEETSEFQRSDNITPSIVSADS